ncbi:hypothetical protein IAD21_05454 [Abditibacteriota bacterium]|nr:hypothetical protein IAD21_05454 [Abditibacteriota bacterium]
MSKPNNPAPPYPPSFNLDYHTRQSFDPVDWSSPVEARFKLESPELKEKIFIRCAALSRGTTSPIAQLSSVRQVVVC